MSDTPIHTYATTDGTEPHAHVEHEPRTVAHTVASPEGTDLSMMTEIGDGVFVAWSDCRKCKKRVRNCRCEGGPVEPDFMQKWRDARFERELTKRPEPGYKMLPSVLDWARERNYIVANAGEVDTLFTSLFAAVAACEAPAGTQVDDVLSEFQAAYDRITGTPEREFCWECHEDGERTVATRSDENGPLCEGCYYRRVEDGLIDEEVDVDKRDEDFADAVQELKPISELKVMADEGLDRAKEAVEQASSETDKMTSQQTTETKGSDDVGF